jgi:hypothetical protein
VPVVSGRPRSCGQDSLDRQDSRAGDADVRADLDMLKDALSGGSRHRASHQRSRNWGLRVLGLKTPRVRRADSLMVGAFRLICTEFSAKRFGLLWRGGRDGFCAKERSHCCNSGVSTLILILNTDSIVFGSSRRWSRSRAYRTESTEMETTTSKTATFEDYPVPISASHVNPYKHEIVRRK